MADFYRSIKLKAYFKTKKSKYYKTEKSIYKTKK